MNHYKVINLKDNSLIEIIGSSIPEDMLKIAASECGLRLEPTEPVFTFDTSEQGNKKLNFARDVFEDRYKSWVDVDALQVRECVMDFARARALDCSVEIIGVLGHVEVKLPMGSVILRRSRFAPKVVGASGWILHSTSGDTLTLRRLAAEILESYL